MDFSTQISKTWKLIISCIIYYCNFSQGYTNALIPSSLLQLSHKFETNISTISHVFALKTFSFLLGSVVSGFFLNFINRKISIPFVFILFGVVHFLIPYAPSLEIFFGLASIGSFMCALYVTTQVVWIIDLWQKEAALYIQIQHFTLALGSAVTPILMNFYLPEQPSPSDLSPLENSNLNQSVMHAPHSVSDLRYPEILNITSHIHIPFFIGGVISIVGGLLLGIPYWFSVEDNRNTGDGLDQLKNRPPEKGIEPVKAKNGARIALILLSATVVGAYQGLEGSSFNFLSTFAQFIDLKLSQREGSLVLSGMAAAFTFGRGLGVIAILKICPQVLVLASFVLVLLGNTIMLTLGNTSVVAFWSGAVFLGLGFSTLVPSYYGYIEKYLKVTHFVGGAMGVASGCALTIYPIIIGSYIELTPFILLYTNYFSLVLCAASFWIIYVIIQNAVKSEIKVNKGVEGDDTLGMEIPLKSTEFDI